MQSDLCSNRLTVDQCQGMWNNEVALTFLDHSVPILHIVWKNKFDCWPVGLVFKSPSKRGLVFKSSSRQGLVFKSPLRPDLQISIKAGFSNLHQGIEFKSPLRWGLVFKSPSRQGFQQKQVT